MKAKETYTIDLNGKKTPLHVRRHSQARNIILRIDDKTGGALLVLPERASLREGLALARSKASWIASQLAALAPKAPFIDGGVLPFLGAPHRIVHCPGNGLVRRVGGEIRVGGRLEHLPRRLADWLKAEARRRIEPKAEAFAARLGLRIRRIAVRDTRSRWGSCSANGNLSFCWRLVMAPEDVIEYVAAHEVAHLLHMNHGKEFWRAMHELTKNPKAARGWLKQNGENLRRHG